MVTIVNYKERVSKDGEVFFALEVQGGIEMIRSKSTGQYYASAKKASIPSTFDENTCKGMIGTQMAGSIEKKACEPFEYTVRETGEVIELNHRYVFVAEEELKSGTTVESIIKSDNQLFSQNGVH